MDDTSAVFRCPRCGAQLPVDRSEGLCPACLFAVAAGSLSTDALTRLSDLTGTPQEQAARLTPGQVFGPYRIERLLGRGGMGDVYEAQHVDQGRRVALKVLNRRLAGVEDRARFLREGQLAASINHPHSVYIFGSEDIDGTPAISMELLPGGTLKDLVKERGPLPPAEAVDAILHVIAGLDALQAVDVLHRDVKPGNCFVDRDGTVKVGDFGLSISTLARDVSLTSAGTFLGTPQFASPEQLKGHPVDVRSDIYAVGATLYYLLTGRPPFDDTNLLALVARIAAEAPPSPRTLMPRVPRGLATIVLGCLAKDRAQRPGTYAALHDALQPFSSAMPTPAALGLRFGAWAIDSTTLSIPWLLVNVGLTLNNLSSLNHIPPSQRWLFIIQIATWIAYYGIPEGVWGASIGKRLMGLRVVIARGGRPPGVPRASLRALIFFAPSSVFSAAVAFLGYDQIRVTSPFLVPLLIAAATALIFSTARRRNGFAGIHELWSGTRVVHRVKEAPLPSLGIAMEHSTDVNGPSRRLGPFDVVGTLGRTDVGTLLLGFDSRLRRRVWLHEVPAGVPPVAALVRDLGRPGRLRWLGERRTSTERWDAYEALDGAPLLSLLARPRTWRVVRQWVADLAQEISAGLSDTSLSRLELDRVWITSQGRAKLLDFRVPGAPHDSSRLAPAESAQTFLSQVAIRSLTGDERGMPIVSRRRLRRTLPQSATALLDALEHQRVDSWADVVRRTTALANGPERVERWRRATSLGLAVAIPVGLATTSVVGMAVAAPAVMRAITPEVHELSFLLNRLSGLDSRNQEPASRQSGGGTTDRAALETYIAGRFGPMVTNPRFWSDPLTGGFLGRHRRLLERIVTERPLVSADELAAATATLGPVLKQQARMGQVTREMSPWIALGVVPFLFAVAAIVAVLSACLFRGGLFLRALNIVVVTTNGEPVSRLRALWRGLGAWGVFFVALLIPFAATSGGYPGPADAGMAVVAVAECAFGLAGAVWAVMCPERGLQDRIAGTYLVPR